MQKYNNTQLTISPMINANAINDEVRLSSMLITITIEMLAVTNIYTHLVIDVVQPFSSSSCCTFVMVLLMAGALTFINFKSNSSGNEKLAYPSISNPLQFTNASKNEALYVSATSIHGNTFDNTNERKGETPASLMSVSFANRQ